MSFRTTVILDLGADGYGEAINIMAYDVLSISFRFTGTRAGTVDIEVSNEENRATDGYVNQNIGAPSFGLGNAVGSWHSLAAVKNFAVTNSFSTTAVSAGSKVAYNLQNLGFKWLRPRVTSLTGTGDCIITLCGKRNKTSNL